MTQLIFLSAISYQLAEQQNKDRKMIFALLPSLLMNKNK